MNSTPAAKPIKRKEISPIENIAKKVMQENDQTSNNNAENPNMSDPQQQQPLSKAAKLIQSVKSTQIYAINNSNMSKEAKDQALLILETVSPMLATLLEGFTTMMEDSNAEKIKTAVSKELEDNNTRIQHCVIETLFANDKVDCRLRYANLRVSGLDTSKHDSPKNAIIQYADDHGIKLSPSQIVEVKSLAREGDKYNPFLVCFDSVHSRETFIKAKFNAINKRKAVGETIDQLMATEETENIAKAEQLRRKEYYPLKRVRISEDLTPMRQSLYKVVKDSENVKYAYTRNAVIHAIIGGRKVKIFSPSDLHLVNIRNIPVDRLRIPQAVKDLSGMTPSTE